MKSVYFARLWSATHHNKENINNSSKLETDVLRFIERPNCLHLWSSQQVSLWLTNYAHYSNVLHEEKTRINCTVLHLEEVYRHQTISKFAIKCNGNDYIFCDEWVHLKNTATLWTNSLLWVFQIAHSLSWIITSILRNGKRNSRRISKRTQSMR